MNVWNGMSLTKHSGINGLFVGRRIRFRRHRFEGSVLRTKLYGSYSLCTTGDGITIRSQILCQILFHLSCCFKGHRI